MFCSPPIFNYTIPTKLEKPYLNTREILKDYYLYGLAHCISGKIKDISLFYRNSFLEIKNDKQIVLVVAPVETKCLSISKEINTQIFNTLLYFGLSPQLNQNRTLILKKGSTINLKIGEEHRPESFYFEQPLTFDLYLFAEFS